jgi:hypothetical protein
LSLVITFRYNSKGMISLKEIIDKPNFIKIKNHCSVKDTTKSITQATY